MPTKFPPSFFRLVRFTTPWVENYYYDAQRIIMKTLKYCLVVIKNQISYNLIGYAAVAYALMLIQQTTEPTSKQCFNHQVNLLRRKTLQFLKIVSWWFKHLRGINSTIGCEGMNIKAFVTPTISNSWRQCSWLYYQYIFDFQLFSCHKKLRNNHYGLINFVYMPSCSRKIIMFCLTRPVMVYCNWTYLK